MSAYDPKLVAEYLASNASDYDTWLVDQLRAASGRIKQLERAIEQAAQIAEAQELYADVHAAQAQIAAKIRALAREEGEKNP